MVQSFYEAAWVFFIYSFLGWCTEVVFHVVSKGRFINRGFLIGPVCPIYGMGILAVVCALSPLADNLLLLYLGSVLITSAIELALGWLSKQVLHERLWDYSNVPFNLGGYICLEFSLIWGLACLGVVRLVHPAILRVIRWLPRPLGDVLVWVFAVMILADLIVTGIEALQIPRQMHAVQELDKLLRGFSESVGTGLSDPVLELMEKRPEMEARLEKYKQALSKEKRAEWEERAAHWRAQLAQRNGTQRRLTKAYPHFNDSPLLQRARRWREYEARRHEKRQGEENASAGIDTAADNTRSV